MSTRVYARGFVALLTGVAMAAMTAQAQITWHVDDDADPNGNGMSWVSPFQSVQTALATASAGDEIRIAGGVYSPSEPIDPNDPRTATFQPVNGVEVGGGYAGLADPSGPDVRDPDLYETVLSGDIGTPGVDADNCYHVLVCGGVEASTVLDGVTVTGGNADGTGMHRQGGGMYLAGGSPTVRDCTFRQNSAEYGGGVFNNGGCPTLLRTTFDQNSATASGGALYNFYCLGQPGPTLTECTFSDNIAESSGGALRNYDSDAILTDCVFSGNHTRYGGAAVANGGQSGPLFARCVFEFNRTDTLFAPYDCYGGGMHNTDSSQPVLVSCVFVGNAAYATLPWLSYGGALAQSDAAQPTLINCTLDGNYANIADGLHSDGQSSTTVVSSILWNGGDEITNGGDATVAVTYSTVAGYWPGTGNIADDPLLEDLRPLAGSPCIDAGDPGFVPDPDDRDLDGRWRVWDGDDDGTWRVDMGAYEFGAHCPGDLDGDNAIDLTDLAGLLANYGVTSGMTPADGDSDLDGDLDLADLSALLAVYGTACE